MTKEGKILLFLILLLFIAVTIPFLPDTVYLRFHVGVGRPITIIEYLKNIILSIMPGL